MGISPVLTERIYETIAEINQQGMTILLVEQNANYRARRLQARVRAGDRQGGDVRQLRRAADQPRSAEGIPRNMTLLAGLTDGAWNLFWLYVWLVSAIFATYLSERKGYGDRPGLATGLFLSALGAMIWLSFRPSRSRSGGRRARSGTRRRLLSSQERAAAGLSDGAAQRLVEIGVLELIAERQRAARNARWPSVTISAMSP